MNTRLIIIAAASLAVTTGIAWSDSHEAACALSYEVFEESVPHTDMQTCPASLGISDDAMFCRVSVLAEVATVFVFQYDDGCLVEARNFFEDEFDLDID